jgi:GntR family transcriptional repressor for pyruvate dehydrogenase complex
VTGQSEDPSGGRLPSKEGLAQRLELELLSDRPAAGTQLPPERELAARFGVSRPMIREVLRSLEERGLIVVAPGRGSFIRDFHWEDAARPLDSIYRRREPTPRDLVQARMMLERETVSLAAEHAAEEDVGLMTDALTRFEASREVVSRARADVDFHAGVARASHNPVIETMFASIIPLAFELMLRSLGDPTVSREGVPYHREILEAIRAHDPEKAEKAMVGHLSIAFGTYGQDLDCSLDVVAQRKIKQLLERDEH